MNLELSLVSRACVRSRLFLSRSDKAKRKSTDKKSRGSSDRYSRRGTHFPKSVILTDLPHFDQYLDHEKLSYTLTHDHTEVIFTEQL